MNNDVAYAIGTLQSSFFLTAIAYHTGLTMPIQVLVVQVTEVQL
jgi:hypothetical protein